MSHYRIHIMGLMHVPVSEKYIFCAFTQKLVKFNKMMLSLGHEVYLYGAESSDAPCTEFIETHSLQDIRDTFGDGSDTELGYNWQRDGFKNEVEMWRKSRHTLYPRYLANIIGEINKRKQPQDILCLPGLLQRPIGEVVGLPFTVESGIGYNGSFANFRAFESNFIKNYTYGHEFHGHTIHPSQYDRVIPNYFDDKDFEFKEAKQNYFLYLGRITMAKGVDIAIDVADKLNTKLIIAGTGVDYWNPGTGEIHGREFKRTSKNIEFVGFADANLRKMLMANAKAVFVPSRYTEPFGGVNVEAQLSGTPVLTTPHGVFPETVRHGETGFICHTMQEFIDNAQRVGELDPKAIRKHAERYLMDNVKHEYQAWFDLIHSKLFPS